VPPESPYPLYMFFSSMHPSWQSRLSEAKDLLTEIERQLIKEPETTPPAALVMRAFERPFESVKVLLIGQDPYPTKGVACGLAFAVSETSSKPQSLRNLMKELATDLPGLPNSGDLSRWSEQGVMMLNSALTTKIGSPGSHAKIWSGFTKAVIAQLDSSSLVCLSLGDHAKKLSQAIVEGEIIQATHPSPLSASRGFYGSRIYSRVNSALQSKGLAPIDWSC
jgi:uracil-DNA glycosylase